MHLVGHCPSDDELLIHTQAHEHHIHTITTEQRGIRWRKKTKTYNENAKLLTYNINANMPAMCIACQYIYIYMFERANSFAV